MNLWNKLKQRWGVTNNIQVVIIFCIFALTGFSTLYVHNLIDALLGINTETAFWIRLIIFVFLVLPVFSIFLYIWGSLLGQRKFVTEFIKYKIGLIFRRKRNNEL